MNKRLDNAIKETREYREATEKDRVAEIKVKLKPFTTPNYVIPDNGGESIHISEVDEDTLNLMCDIFRKNVLKKAKRK